MTGWDPTGLSTEVVPLGDGQYQITSVNIEDNDLGIYVVSQDGDSYARTGEKLGETTSITSFYDADISQAKINSIIDLNDRAGVKFLNYIYTETPDPYHYATQAGHNEWLDFKTSNFIKYPNQRPEGLDEYRGMQIDTKGNTRIITSARDIGNIAAGYVMGYFGASWIMTRVAFDLYQGNWTKFVPEESSSVNAQLYGYQKGRQASPAPIPCY